jgi:hypothetical protein
VSGNPAVLVHVNAKSVQDRYVKLQRKYDLQDQKERNMTGLGGEFCEIDDLLGQMQEEKEFLDAKKCTEPEAARKRELRKEHIGKLLVARSLKRVTRSESFESLPDVEAGSNRSGSSKSAKQKSVSKREDTYKSDPSSFGLMHFSKTMHETESVRVQLEQDRLELERQRLENEKEERNMDRDERRVEREEDNKIELEKFRLILEMFKSK